MPRKFVGSKQCTPCGRRKSLKRRLALTRQQCKKLRSQEEQDTSTQSIATIASTSDFATDLPTSDVAGPSHSGMEGNENLEELINLVAYDSDDSNPRSLSQEQDSSLCHKYPNSKQYSDEVSQRNQTAPEIFGRRIVDINFFFNEVTNFNHLRLFGCDSSNLQITKEIATGFQSTFVIKCSICNEEKRISTESDDTAHLNKLVVLGMISTGGGYKQMQEIFSYCDIPVMSNYTFLKIQNDIADVIHATAWEEMRKAGEEEKAIAIRKGKVDPDDIPYITVIADGAWSKRSYKVNYNALSGVAIIVGQETKKILFLGVKNRYCCICTRAESRNMTAKDHICYKNWDKASTGMESEIIVEGFCQSIELHGIKYGYLVGDGDSSVTKKLAEARPYQHRIVQKIECRNHLLRNLCTRLRDLAQRRTSSQHKVVSIKERNMLSKNVKRIRCGIVSAVNYYINKEDLSHAQKIILLKRDITNTASHVFGDHSKCATYFCQGPKVNEINFTTIMRNSGLFSDVLVIIERMVRLSESLLFNMDNNAAELYNSLLAKTVGGKRINFSLRRSYETRCEKAAISYNVGAESSRLIQKTLCGRSPGNIHKKFINERKQRHSWTKRRRELFPQTQKKKHDGAPPDEDYGLPAIDMDENEYKLKQSYLMTSMAIDKESAHKLERDTVGQADTLLWIEERGKRLTASNFGKICKLRKSTHCANTVKAMLYSNFCGTSATNWGKEHERIAICEFERSTDVTVEECGLFVSAKHCYLGATPDGLIGKNGIVEVKCPRCCSTKTPREGIESKILKFATIENGNFTLKRNHDYYYQVQGQLQITSRQYCYFIVWTPLELEYEKIYRDDQFWKEKMEEQLKIFFFGCLLPEMINPQYPNKRKIKDLRPHFINSSET